MKVFVSFSGGKESVFALYQALKEGLEIEALLTMFNTTGLRTRGHALKADFLKAQAEALGFPLIMGKSSWNSYERVFKSILKRLKRKGLEGGIFGDIYLEEHKEWVQRVCSEVGLLPFLPLWGKDPKNVFEDFVQSGFKAIIISLQPPIPKDFIGKELILQMLETFNQLQMDPCGERGEYHTAVLDGPIFKKKLEICKSKVIKAKHKIRLEIEEFVLRKK